MAKEESRSTSCKKTIYFPSAMLDEIQQECTRLERSFSWVMQRAWRIARETVQEMPGVELAETTDQREAEDAHIG